MEETTPVPIPTLLVRLAEAAEASAVRLASWGIKLPPDSRLHAASDLLRAAAATGQVQPNPNDVIPVLRAIWVAADFADIAAYLPEDRVRSVRQELDIAVAGALWPLTGARQPLQYQTQHWIGAVLLHSGITLDHIAYSSKRQQKNPEFWIWNGSIPIGVEVKRPESAKRIPDMLIEAMEKFRARQCYAAIVVEISDCLSPGAQADLLQQAAAIERTMHDTIMDKHFGRMRSPFDCLIYAGCVFRNAWEVPPDDPTRLRLFGHALHQGYPGHEGTLKAIKSDWFRAAMNTAFSAVVARVGALASRPVA